MLSSPKSLLNLTCVNGYNPIQVVYGASKKSTAMDEGDQVFIKSSQHLSRVQSLPNGTLALNSNGINYDTYVNDVMPGLKLSKAQKWATWMIRSLYQGTTRNTIYKWFGNPCLHKRQGNLSCSEYTLMLIQTCGLKRGVIQGWHRISNEGPNPFTHPKMWLTTLPFIGKHFMANIPDIEKAPPDKPIPLSWFKDPKVAAKLAQLP